VATASLGMIYSGDPLGPFRVKMTGSYASVDPCYLIFDLPNGFRRILSYLPGGGSVGGSVVTESGVSYWEFQQPAEWTRVAENLPPGVYTVYPRLGELTGMDADTANARTFEVKMPTAGRPLGAA
jgi:hypothetical protein